MDRQWLYFELREDLKLDPGHFFFGMKTVDFEMLLCDVVCSENLNVLDLWTLFIMFVCSIIIMFQYALNEPWSLVVKCRQAF